MVCLQRYHRLVSFYQGGRAHGDNEIILRLCRDIFENSRTYTRSVPAEQRISEIEAQKVNGTKSRLKESHIIKPTVSSNVCSMLDAIILHRC